MMAYIRASPFKPHGPLGPSFRRTHRPNCRALHYPRPAGGCQGPQFLRRGARKRRQKLTKKCLTFGIRSDILSPNGRQTARDGGRSLGWIRGNEPTAVGESWRLTRRFWRGGKRRFVPSGRAGRTFRTGLRTKASRNRRRIPRWDDCRRGSGARAECAVQGMRADEPIPRRSMSRQVLAGGPRFSLRPVRKPAGVWCCAGWPGAG